MINIPPKIELEIGPNLKIVLSMLMLVVLLVALSAAVLASVFLT